MTPALRNLALDMRERIRRIGWDVPIRPAHVPVPTYPQESVMTAIRASMAFCLAFVATSIVPSAVIAGPAHFARPLLGLPTVVDAIAKVALTLSASFSLHISFTQAAIAQPAPPAPSFPWLTGYVFALLPCAIVGIIAAVALVKRPRTIPDKYAAMAESDEWATMHDFERSKLLGHNEIGIAIGAIQPPPFLGFIPRPLELLVDANPSHVVEDAASRSGKDVKISMTLAGTWSESVLCNDNKGEQHLLTSGARANIFGNTIHRLCLQAAEAGTRVQRPDGTYFEEAFGTSKHNILDEIPWGTDGEYSALLQVMTLAVCKDMKQLDGDDGHWYRTSRVLGMVLGYKVRYDPLETLRSMPRVAMLLAGDVAHNEQSAAMKQASATDGAEVDSIHSIIEHYLGWSATGMGTRPAWIRRAEEAQRTETAQRLLIERRKIGISISEKQYADFERAEQKKLVARIAKMDEAMVHPDLERAIRNTMRIRGDEAGSVYSTINSQMSPWLDPRVIANTATSTLSFFGMVNSDMPQTTYVVNSPDYGDMFKPLYRIWFDLFLRTLVPQMQQNAETKQMVAPHRHPILCIWNEPMTIGEIPSLVPILPFSASYGMRHLFPYQLASQRREQFGDNEPISGNCFTHVYHAPNDFKEQREISDACGKRLVITESETRNFMSSPSHNVSPSSIPLITPAQVKAIPNDVIPYLVRDANGQEVMRRNAEGMVEVKEQAYQIVSMRRGIGYTRKIQWYTDEFPGIYRAIKRYSAVAPSQSNVVFRDNPGTSTLPLTPTVQEEAPAPKPINSPSITLERLDIRTEGSQKIATRSVDENAASAEIPLSFEDMLK